MTSNDLTLETVIFGLPGIGSSSTIDPARVIIKEMPASYDAFPYNVEELPKRQSFKNQGSLSELERRMAQRRNAVAEMQEAAQARRSKRSK